MTSNVRFAGQAERAFSFLVDEGFRLVETNASIVRSESDRVSVEISWDPRSGELNLFLGVARGEHRAESEFSLTDLLAMESVDIPERQTPFQVADESRLLPFPRTLAEDLRLYAPPALRGDRMFFHRLKAYRGAQSQKYLREMKCRRSVRKWRRHGERWTFRESRRFTRRSQTI
jgi:hypothetical protein